MLPRPIHDGGSRPYFVVSIPSRSYKLRWARPVQIGNSCSSHQSQRAPTSCFISTARFTPDHDAARGSRRCSLVRTRDWVRSCARLGAVQSSQRGDLFGVVSATDPRPRSLGLPCSATSLRRYEPLSQLGELQTLRHGSTRADFSPCRTGREKLFC